jgi:hypothetical protein
MSGAQVERQRRRDLLNVPHPIEVQSMKQAKADCEALLSSVFPLAEKMLTEHREFYPYGATMGRDGQINYAGADNGTVRPKSADLIELLKTGYIAGARSGQYEATALVMDTLFTADATTGKTDAIAVALDHRDGYSVMVIYPYRFEAGRLVIEAPIAQQGAAEIFPPQ